MPRPVERHQMDQTESLLGAWRFNGKMRSILAGKTLRIELLAAAPSRTCWRWACRRCKVNCLLIEAKASGLSAAQELRRLHGREDWQILEVNPKGDKMARALAGQPILAQGKIWAPDRAWADL